MKKIIAAIILLVWTCSLASCAQAPSDVPTSVAETEGTTEAAAPQESAPTKLVNKMTETERDAVKKHALTILDAPAPLTAKTEHTVAVEYDTRSIAELREQIEADRETMGEEAYQDAVANLDAAEADGKDSLPMSPIILVDGIIITQYIPSSDPDYEGGMIEFQRTTMDENWELKTEDLHFDTFEDYLDWIRETDIEVGVSEEETELDVLYTRIAEEAFQSGNYETLPEGSVDTEDLTHYLWGNRDYRDEWEFDRDAVAAIKDNIDEIDFADEALHETFVVHVMRPPNYDPSKTYPLFFLTDGIWRFGNFPALWQAMEDGEAAPVIVASLYYSYNITDPDQVNRYYDLVLGRDKLLDFVTDDVMPYLCENYSIDCADSTLYGHSDGGVFAHYAMFCSDRYENQPFGRYIIGSPAFWGVHDDVPALDTAQCRNDYGYFDRSETLGKRVFLCAGSQEDPDYADMYEAQDDTTLEGVAKLKERLEAHGADLTYRLYESHHYQYIPEMLVEYLKETCPN